MVACCVRKCWKCRKGVRMPRTARKKSATGIYHVLMRGINQQRIFEDEDDFALYLQILERVKRENPFILYAYCLMDNHVHLLVGERDASLSRVVQRIGGSYAYRFNQKYDRSGHLFQDRFKSEPVEDDAYFVTVLRYIHANPVKAGLCRSAEQYRWSSCRWLGCAGGLVDKPCLFDIVSREELATASGSEGEGVDPFPASCRGRRQRLEDDDAMALLKGASGVDSSGAFQRLSKQEQRRAVGVLFERGSSIRQVARITGLSKGVVEAWRKQIIGN